MTIDLDRDGLLALVKSLIGRMSFDRLHQLSNDGIVSVNGGGFAELEWQWSSQFLNELSDGQLADLYKIEWGRINDA